MICPYCGKRTPDNSEFCAECGYPLDEGARRKAAGGRPAPEQQETDPGVWQGSVIPVLRAAIIVLTWLISLTILGYGVYKVYYWRQNSQTLKMYETGMLAKPLLEAVTLSDGRPGHVVTFFGEDGDSIYIEELQRSYLVVGGRAKVEIADSYWFEKASEEVQLAEIALTPVKTLVNGGKELLPVVYFTVEVPTSPFRLISPGENQEPILSSEYQLEFEVVPGSTVLVDGVDVTDLVSSMGEVSVNVAVYPQGDNPISILVRTAHHKETRADIVLYRQPMEIDLALAINTSKKSVINAMTIRGSVAPEATISVDTPYLEGSLTQDENGSFSFVATFDTIGYNTVRFRAQQEGKQDSIISFEVYYLPTLNEYSRKAWAMDYTQLTRCWDIWAGRIFKCTGTVDAILSYDPQVIVLDVSKDNSGDFIVIENLSNLSITEVGGKFDFYADVSGMREEYMNRKYPYLIGRYASAAEE
ncbi:MAG: zinc ribbon domain-containing protein [Clostridia bacterium]|nr:zinc ribbon domain-containing protein [Clostridia bacterium]